MTQQGFPKISTPLIGPGGQLNQPWLQFFISLWNRTGGGIGSVVNSLQGLTGALTLGSSDILNITASAQIINIAFNPEPANAILAGPTSGVASIPAFRSLVGADLPYPSLTSLGGIEAIAPLAHNWVNSISTSGVPTLSQPGFGDISGDLSLATQVSGLLPAQNGGTGIDASSASANQVLIGTGSGIALSTSASTADIGVSGNAGTVTTINGLVAAGTNVTLTGSGTSASPYTIAASGGGGSPGGSSGQVQYNGGGSFAGSTQLVFNDNALSVGGETALTYAQQVIRANSTKYAHLALTGYALSGGSQGDDDGFVMGMGYSDAGYGRQLWLGSTETYNNAGRSMFRIGIGGSVTGYKAFMDGVNGTGTAYNDLYIGGDGVALYFGVSGVQPVIPNASFIFWSLAAANYVVTITRGNSGQTGDIQQWQNNSGTVLSGVTAAGSIYSGNSVTGSRPTVSVIGAQWFDTTLGIPIWWNGTGWVNASGGSV